MSSWSAFGAACLFHLTAGLACAQSIGPVYLAYAGPYSASPSSSFGHLFLVIARSREQPILLADVITFNAMTEGAGPLRYLMSGIAGGFQGRFSRRPFHEQVRAYGQLEDRDLWLLQLDLTPIELESLDSAIASALPTSAPYAFFTKNCAYYLQELLASSTGRLAAPRGIVSPSGLFMSSLRSGLGTRTFFRPAASTGVAELASSVGSATIDAISARSWVEVASDTGFLNHLSTSDLAFAHAYFALKSIQTIDAIPPEATAGIGATRVRLVGASGLPHAVAPAGPGEPVSDLDFHPYGRVRLTHVSRTGAAARVSLQIRAAMHDEEDPWQGHPRVSAMELLSLEVSSPLARAAPRIERVTLLSQHSLVPTTWIRPQASWMFEVQGARGGIAGGDAIQGELRGGLGRTLSLGSGAFVHALGTAALAASGNGARLAPGMEAGALLLPAPYLRFGARYRVEHDALAWHHRYERYRAFVRIDLGSAAGLVVAVERGPLGNQTLISLDRY